MSFDDLLLTDGRHFRLQSSVTPGSGQVISFVAAAEGKEKKKSVKDAASEKTKQAKEQAQQQWDNAMKQLKTPGRMHRLKRYVEAQLQVHRQYIPVGTVYFAELTAPLDFGTEPMTPEVAASIGGPLPPGSVDMKKNGQLRIAFQQLIPPDGIAEKVEATLEGVQSGKDANVRLDSEGGAEATTPKTRYLATAVSLTLAAASAVRGGNDLDNGVAHIKANTGAQVAGGVYGRLDDFRNLCERN